MPVSGVSVTSASPEPFSIQRHRGTDWLVRPDGTRLFSLGVCCVDQGTAREKYDPEKPGYAAWRYYSSSNAWAEATLQRLSAWGFTTVGGWSDYAALKEWHHAAVAFTPVLHMGSTAGAPWWDMWDPKIIARMEQVARDQILAVRDDPRLLGYYSDNEMGWWNVALFRLTLEQVPTSGQRQRLLQLLRRTYRRDWSALCLDFDPEGAASFEDLDRGGRLYLRPGSDGMRTMRQFVALAAARYYALVRELIRKYDTRALILGDRYQSFYYPEVAQASAGHLDAASSNLNAGWNDGSFPRYYLDTLEALTRRPVFVSEFYLATRENRSGNENKPGHFPLADTPGERIAGFRRTIESLLRLPYVVGADWFQYYDEPTFGRPDGENYSFGLVDIHNQPYADLVEAAAALDLTARRIQRPPPRPDASRGVPPAPREPFATFEPHLALKGWDREQGYVKPVSKFPMADLYVCWSPEALYLGLYAQDVVEQDGYRDRRVPEVDRAEWTVQAGKPRWTIRARIGAGGPAVVSEPALRLVHLAGVELTTRCIAAMELPASWFGRRAFREGEQVEFSSSFLTHCWVYRTDWRGRFRLNGPR